MPEKEKWERINEEKANLDEEIASQYQSIRYFIVDAMDNWVRNYLWE